MQNAVMHIAVHQCLIVKIIPLSPRLCTRLCTLIHTTGTVRQFTYHMKRKQLEEVNSEKDLGVIISSNLKVARFTRLFKDLRSREYDERLKILRLWSLEERRHASDLLELFEMVRGLSAIPLTSFFKLADRSAGSVRPTRGHA